MYKLLITITGVIIIIIIAFFFNIVAYILDTALNILSFHFTIIAFRNSSFPILLQTSKPQIQPPHLCRISQPAVLSLVWERARSHMAQDLGYQEGGVIL